MVAKDIVIRWGVMDCLDVGMGANKNLGGEADGEVFECHLQKLSVWYDEGPRVENKTLSRKYR